MLERLESVVIFLHGVPLVTTPAPRRPDEDGTENGDRTENEHDCHRHYSTQSRGRWVPRMSMCRNFACSGPAESGNHGGVLGPARRSGAKSEAGPQSRFDSRSGRIGTIAL